MISLTKYTRFVSNERHALRLLPWLVFAALVISALVASLALQMNVLDTGFAATSIFTLIVVSLITGVFALAHFHRLLLPLSSQMAQTVADQRTPLRVGRRLAHFSRDFWVMQLVTDLAITLVLSVLLPLSPQDAFKTSLVLVAINVLVGVPLYLIALDLLGTLIRPYGLARVHISLKTRLVLIGALVPLLGSALLVQYYSVLSGAAFAEAVKVWLMLAGIFCAITLIAIASLNKALGPVQQMMAMRALGKGADLSLLQPLSTDEIGYLTHALGRVSRRLKEKNSHVRAIFDAAAEGIILVGEDGRIQTLNPAAEQLFGCRNHELRGKPVTQLLPGLNLLESAGIEQEIIGCGSHTQGKPLSVRLSAMELAGKHMHVCMVADISERKAAEIERLEAEARYRDLVETAHDLVWCLDVEGRWSYLNEAALRIYACKPEEMIGRRLDEFSDEKYRPSDRQMLAHMVRGEDVVQHETVHVGCDGKRHYLSFNGKVLRDADGQVVQCRGTARDITEQKEYEQKLYYQAQHDSLTGLYNRNYFRQELERVVSRVARSGAECALFYIDLDQFKYVNDTLGHAAGDRLLVEVTLMCRALLRDGDIMARFGGDEFTILLYDVEEDAALLVAEKLRVAFDGYRFLESGKSFNVTCSLGIAMISNQIQDPDEVMSQADLACNLAKTQGRNRVVLYDAGLNDKEGMVEDMGWASRVRDAVEQDKFRLVFQPIIALADANKQSYEVLLRMISDDGSIIMPGGFIPAAERFGLINNVDRWLVHQALWRLAELNRTSASPVSFSINLSGRAFDDPALLPLIHKTLEETGLDPRLVTFEITETATIAKLSAAATFITGLRNIGCEFALDDFGVGFSSFSYLKHLPVDKLKIDGGFIKNMSASGVDQAMVQSIAQVARALGKTTVAEAVEDEATLDLLRDYGVDYAQGYYLGRPDAGLVFPILH